MKKGLILICFFISAISVNLQAYYADLNMGSAGIASMNNYGFHFENAVTGQKYSLHDFTNLMVLTGYTANVEETATAAVIEATFGKSLIGNNLIGYTKFSLLPGLLYHADYSMPYYDRALLKMNLSANILYIGVGMKYQIYPLDNFCVYFTGDIGYMIVSGNMLLETYNQLTDSYEKDDNMSGSQTYGGIAFNAGAGVKYYFTNQLYADAGAGFSGMGRSFILTAGIGYDFDRKAAKNSYSKSSDTENLGSTDPKAASYEAYGDKIYKTGDYRLAFKYYSGASKIEKSRLIMKKIGNCYNALGMSAEAKMYYDYAEKLR
jgi:hypothetical protein